MNKDVAVDVIEELPTKDEIQTKLLIGLREKTIQEIVIAEIREKMAKRNVIKSVKPDENEKTALSWKNKRKHLETQLEFIEEKLKEVTNG